MTNRRPRCLSCCSSRHVANMDEERSFLEPPKTSVKKKRCQSVPGTSADLAHHELDSASSSGFRSAATSDFEDESNQSSASEAQGATSRKDDDGFGQSPKMNHDQDPVLTRRKISFSRSCSAPNGLIQDPLLNSEVLRSSLLRKRGSLFTKTLPRVTISDFSSLSIDESISAEDGGYTNEVDYVTLEDVERFKVQKSVNSLRRSLKSSNNLIRIQNADPDSWSYTNSSLGEDHDLSDLEDNNNQESDFMARISPSGWRKVRNMVQWTPFIQTFKNRKYQWVQLAGHSGNFQAGRNQGTVLKKLCPQEEQCYDKIRTEDSLAPFVPEYQGTLILDKDEKFIQLQDCLSSFVKPSIMDCKIGVRTYLEEELAKAKEKPKLRKDMFEKMIAVDPSAPTEEERRLKGVTKPRYMVWRETISSTATLGFRVEGVKKSDGTSSKDYKTTKTREQVIEAFRDFISSSSSTAKQYLERLQAIKKALSTSNFFKTHELIGSSLLFVHDSNKACIWLIDFGKTIPLPSGTIIDHKTPWVVGNHEDGYLIGMENLISIFAELARICHQT